MIPIPEVTKENKEGVIRLVTAMLAAQHKFAGAKTDREKNYYQARMVSIDREIDNTVFNLFALENTQIGIIEGTESEATESEATESEATESEATESEATESEAIAIETEGLSDDDNKSSISLF